VAAVLTPPDVLSQLMLAIPLCILYELGIVLAGFIKERSKAPPEEAQSTTAPPPA
jgi:sec-independent protein translocase protein TatC